MPIPVTTEPLEIPDVLLVRGRFIEDNRGFFTEIYSQAAFKDAGLTPSFVQDNFSESVKGVVRGLHYQIEPHAMGKLVRVLRGSVFDVAVDLRDGSPYFGDWTGHTLTAEEPAALWIPPGFAHGFMALTDGAQLFYKCTDVHTPEAERAIRYDDPAIGIEWPWEPTLISEKDAAAPSMAEAEFNFAMTGKEAE